MLNSFYGNVSGLFTRSSFVFDRIYSSRMQMEACAETDGIFNQRFVLVYYGDWTPEETADTSNSLKYINNISESRDKIPGLQTLYGKDPDADVVEAGDIYAYGNTIRYYTQNKAKSSKEITLHPIFTDIPKYNYDSETGNMTIVENWKENIWKKTDTVYFKYWINYLIDETHYTEDNNVYPNNPTNYHCTVWQKIYQDNKERYILVASLNPSMYTASGIHLMDLLQRLEVLGSQVSETLSGNYISDFYNMRSNATDVRYIENKPLIINLSGSPQNLNVELSKVYEDSIATLWGSVTKEKSSQNIANEYTEDENKDGVYIKTASP